jgi:branched-subunit amino acid transport protein
MAVVTFLARYPVLAIVGRVHLPERVFRALRYVPVAVLTAISVPAVLFPVGTLDIRPQNAYLIGGVAAVMVAWRAKSLLPTIIIGMGVFLLWRALFG